MNLFDLARQFEDEAKRIRGLSELKLSPLQSPSIKSAIAKLSSALELEYQTFRIAMTISCNRLGTEIRWSIAVNYRVFEALTLEKALNDALASMREEVAPDPTEEIANVDAELKAADAARQDL